jgi:hypothetical protein
VTETSANDPRVSHVKPRWWHWTPRRGLLVLLAALAIWSWVDVRARGRVDPNALGLHKTDFTVYTEAGAAFFDGRDPYAVTNPRGWGYLYPPLFAMLVAPLHALAPETQVLVWFAISVAAAWGCWVETLRIARVVLPSQRQRPLLGPIPPWIAVAAATAVAVPALNCLQRGQVGIVQVFLLVWGFRLLIESRSWPRSLAAGGLLALPVVLKVTPLVTVGYVLFEQSVAAMGVQASHRVGQLPRASAAVGGLLVGLLACLFLVPSALVGWRANLDHLNTWWTTVAVHAERSADDSLAGDSYSVKNQSLANAVCRLGNWAHYQFGGPHDEGTSPDAHGNRGLLMDDPIVGKTLLVVRALEACLLLAVAYRVGRRQDAIGHAMFFGLACASTLVVAPIARGHYYVQLVPSVIFLAIWLLAAGRRRLALAAAWVPAALVLAHYCLMDVSGRVGLLGIGTTIWLTAAAIMVMKLEILDAPPKLHVEQAIPSRGVRLWTGYPRSKAKATTASRAGAAHMSSTELSR